MIGVIYPEREVEIFAWMINLPITFFISFLTFYRARNVIQDEDHKKSAYSWGFFLFIIGFANILSVWTGSITISM